MIRTVRIKDDETLLTMGLAKIDTREPFGKIISFKDCNYKITGTTMSDGITTEVFVSKVDRSMKRN